MDITVKQEVKIYKPSAEHLDLINTYDYKESKEEINKVEGTCIVHIVPKMDTYLSDAESSLIGLCDSLLFEVKVFDLAKGIYYRDKTLFDDVAIQDINVNSRIYKDLSTMYIFHEPVYICYGNNTLFIEPMM